MSRSLRRGALAAVAALSIASLASACGTGQDPQTLEVKPDSVATTVGAIEIQNAFIITEPSGSGAAVVTGRVFNNSTSAQQLTSVTVDGVAGEVKLTGADGKPGPITIPANGSVTLGGKGNPVAELADSQGVAQGGFQKTVFDFSSTGQVTIDPGVVPAQNYFKAFGPGAPAAPTVSAPPSAVPSGAPSASASGAANRPAGSSSPATTTGAKAGKGAVKGTPQSGAPAASTSSAPKA